MRKQIDGHKNRRVNIPFSIPDGLKSKTSKLYKDMLRQVSTSRAIYKQIDEHGEQKQKELQRSSLWPLI